MTEFTEGPEKEADSAAPETKPEEITQAPASEPGSSLDAELDAAYDRINNPDPEIEAKEEPAKDEDTVKADEKTSRPEKDAEQEEKAEEEQPETPAIEPPLSWSKEAKAKWSEIPPEAQEIIANRERDAHTAITKLGQEVKAYEPLKDTLNHYSEVFKANNLEPAQGVARLLEVQSMLDKDPVAGVREIAKAYSVDLAEFAFEDLQENAPEITSLQNEISELKQRLEARDRADQEQAQQQYQSQVNQMNELVAQFSADKPHFDRLSPVIDINIKAIREREPGLQAREVLEKAYNAALYQDDELREEMQKKHIAEAEKAALEKARKAAEAAALNVSSNEQGALTKANLDDKLDIIWNRHSRA